MVREVVASKDLKAYRTEKELRVEGRFNTRTLKNNKFKS